MAWMTTALIIGSGAAAAGAALALSDRADLEIIVIDIGLQLESDREQLVGALASSSPDTWDEQTIGLSRSSLPPHGIQASRRSAYSARTIRSGKCRPARPPYCRQRRERCRDLLRVRRLQQCMGLPGHALHGGGVCELAGECPTRRAATTRPFFRELPFAGEEDDLAATSRCCAPGAAAPNVAQSRRVLAAYERNRAKLNDRGITIGKARRRSTLRSACAAACA